MTKVSVHLEPITLVGRVYEDGSFEERSPYCAVFSVLLLGEGRARVIAAHGKMGPAACAELARQLHEDWGVAQMEIERHGRQVTIDAARLGARSA